MMTMMMMMMRMDDDDDDEDDDDDDVDDDVDDDDDEGEDETVQPLNPPPQTKKKIDFISQRRTLNALGQVNHHLALSSGAWSCLFDPHLQHFFCSWVGKSLMRHPGLAHFELRKVVLQTHVGRLHLLHIVENFIHVFWAEAVLAQAYHPAPVSAVWYEEIFCVQDTVSKVVPGLLHFLCHVLNDRFLAVILCRDAFDIFGNHHFRGDFSYVPHHPRKCLTGLSTGFSDAVLEQLPLVVLRADLVSCSVPTKDWVLYPSTGYFSQGLNIENIWNQDPILKKNTLA